MTAASTSHAKRPDDWVEDKVRILFLGEGEEKTLAALLQHAVNLCTRNGPACAWHPGALTAGEDVRLSVLRKLDECDMVVMLVGPATPVELIDDVLSSGKKVIPVLSRPFSVELTPVGRLGCLPRPKDGRKFVSQFVQDEVLMSIVGELRGLVEEHRAALTTRARQDVSFASPPVGPNAQDFVEAMCASFDQFGIEDVMLIELGVYMDHEIAPGALRSRVTELHRYLESRGELTRFVAAARRKNPGNPRLRAYAEALGLTSTGYPPWIDALPPPWADPDFQAFQRVLVEHYDNDTDVRILLRQAGVNVGNVVFSNAAVRTWSSALQSTWSQGKARALLDCIRAGRSGHAFARWT